MDASDLIKTLPKALARRVPSTYGVIDRSTTRDTPYDSVTLKGRPAVWNSRRGNHLGQRSRASAITGRTYGRKRSDQNTAKSSCEEGAVHICVVFLVAEESGYITGSTLTINGGQYMV